MARIQIRKVKAPPEFTSPPPDHISNEQSKPFASDAPLSASQIRINPPSQANLFKKPVPGSILTQTKPVTLPQVQVFFSAKGGSGTSLLAATYAGAVKALTSNQVLLIDMDMAAGGIEAYTGIKPSRSLHHLKPVLKELTDTHLRSVVQAEPVTGIDILAGSSTPGFADTLEEWEVEALVRQSKTSYGLVVIDCGSHFHPLAVPLLAAADQIHYILQPDTPSLHRFKLAEAWMLSNGISLQKMAILLNRAGKSNEIQPRDLSRLASLQIEGTVRSDFAAIQSEINLAQPLMLRFRDKKPPALLQDVLRLIRTQTGLVGV